MDGLFGLAVFFVPAVVGIILLLLGNHRRVRRESGVKALFAVGVALIMVSAGAVVWFQLDRYTTHFGYTATLTPDGVGRVRVILPAPVDAALTANLVASPGSASAVVNRTTSEPSIDVTLTEETTVTASFAAYGYSGDPDLGRAASWEACSRQPSQCTAEVSVLVISGNITSVEVSLRAVWSEYCNSPGFSLDARALPGDAGYPADFARLVC